MVKRGNTINAFTPKAAATGCPLSLKLSIMSSATRSFSLILPMHNTESENTQSTESSFSKNCLAKSITDIPWISICSLTNLFDHIDAIVLHCPLWLIFGCMWIVQIIITKMNCGLWSDNHKHSPYQRIHIEVLHFVFWLESGFMSQVRVDFLKMWNVGTRYAEIVRPLRVVLVVDIEIFSGKFPCTFWKTLILVRVYSSEFPRTFAQLCICSPFLIWNASGRLPSTLCYEIRTLLTGCSEYHRATGCTRARRCRRACRRTRDQVQRRLRLRHNFLFSCTLLHPFRHRFGAACWDENADIAQMEKLVHSSRVKLPFVSYVCELVFGVNIFDMDFGVDSVI